ncbi:hypothetical protein GEV29_09075 [Aeromicrobium sp. SMF47]|uniref:hypothetical protein n=1 Tax=Aeromicrobium yanjiei TaxID=2662028 RepID=UPI00129E257C|nr:hypothetical protein [Aeromicrobium yanjiei]MRJ76687.1 hypothetical protein [Aeromicrobium yanjiei]
MRFTRLLPLAAAASLLLLTACSSDDPPSEPTAAPSSSTATTAQPESSPEPEAEAAPATRPQPSGPPAETPKPGGRLLVYETDDVNGVNIASAADTARLTGAPEDFKAFVLAELARAQKSPEPGCSEKPQVYVSRVDTRGWAAGGRLVPQCGGTASLWARPGGTWKEVWSGQQLTDCATLETYDFPADVVGGTCLDGEDERPYTPKSQ